MDTLFTGLRVAVSLAAVLGLLWVIHKKVSKSGRLTKSAKQITVVARQGVSGKASVAVVDVDGVRYVLGVTEQSVNVLSTASAPKDALVTPIAPARAAAASFDDEMVAVSIPAAEMVPLGTMTAPQPADRDHSVSPRRAARAAVAAQTSPVAGSIFSAGTWKQAAAAVAAANGSRKRA